MQDFLWFEEQKLELLSGQIRLYKGGIDRLLQSYSNIEEEAKQEEDRLVSQPVSNPDVDPADYFEFINDRVVEFYCDLIDVRDIHLGFSVLGLFHLFEKQVMGFLKNETKYFSKDNEIKEYRNVTPFLNKYGIEFRSTPFFDSINELRLVSNVIKHGEGDAKNELEGIRQDLFDSEEIYLTPQSFYRIPIGDGILGPRLHLKDEDLERYINGVSGFWSFEFWKSKGERFYRK